jgi:hypothetical protein
VRGRPLKEEQPIGVPTGDPRITEAARRRATRVLKERHRDEFELLMETEAGYLQSTACSPSRREEGGAQ